MYKRQVAKTIASTREARARNIASRKDGLTGVSEFPHLDEVPADVLVEAPASTSTTGGALHPHRLAEPYEALRDACDRHVAAGNAKPEVFLANLGTPAEFTLRATWAGSVFEAGGIRAPQNDGFADMDGLIEAFRASGAQLAVVCSDDATYQTEAGAAASRLKDAGVKQLYLAGRPDEALAQAGIDTFVHAGCDIVQILRDAHAVLGVSS